MTNITCDSRWNKRRRPSPQRRVERAYFSCSTAPDGERLYKLTLVDIGGAQLAITMQPGEYNKLIDQGNALRNSVDRRDIEQQGGEL